MAQAARPHRVTAEEYLRLEREAEIKSEYYFGEVFAMAGGSANHSALAFSLAGIVHAQMKGKPCRGFSSDLRVRTSPEGLYAYPDLTILCGEPEYHDERSDTLTNPTVIFEVLSPTTESFDRGDKRRAFWAIGALQAYVLVSQKQLLVEVYERTGDSEGKFATYSDSDAVAQIPSLGISIPLAELYEGVDFGTG